MAQTQRLTQRQETFCLKYFELGNASEAARVAKYSPHTAGVIGRENLLKPQIQARIQELRKVAEDVSVMSVMERKQKLTEIARSKLTDFMELGQDGSWVNIGPESPNSAAVQEIHSRTEYDENGAHSTVHTSVKLHDPIKAIDLLNKMDKIYTEGTTVNVDNRRVDVVVASENAKKLTEAILAGKGTELANQDNPNL